MTELKNVSRDFERERPNGNGYGGRWHAIYKTHGGLDFCREDFGPDIKTFDQADDAARRLFSRIANHHARQEVGGFALENW